MPHVSYSALKNWNECSWRHKLLYIENLKTFEGNEYTAFGTAVHETVENMLLKNISDPYEYFHKVFSKELLAVGIVEGTDLSREMEDQVVGVFDLVEPALDAYFKDKGGWSLVATEEPLMESITESRVEGYDFKGFIDLVLKDGNDGYHIIDWKTCSWGWNARKKNNILYTRQLVLYKHYYAKKTGLDPKCFTTHFGLIKRTAKKDRIEIFRVTSGKRKTENSLDFMDKALYNISSERYLKNRLSCRYCQFYKTSHCT